MNNLDKFGLPSGLGMPSSTTTRPMGIYEVPTDFVDLPSQGKFYPKDSPLHGVDKVEVKYMTTKEEDILLNQSYIQSGVVLDKMLESVLVDKRIKVEDVLNCDKSAIQVACRANAYGEEYEFTYSCTSCEVKNEATINLLELKHYEVDFETIKQNNGIYITLPSTKAVIKAKILTGGDDQEIQKRIKQKQKQ